MKIRKYFQIFGALILSLIVIRITIGEPCSVPSNSMESTIQTGDWLWIDKFIYGASLPQRASEIPLINIFTWIKPLRELDKKQDWGYHRIAGLREPKQADIIVFKKPGNSHELLVKRLIGLPGDTIQIRGSILFINNNPVEMPSTNTIISPKGTTYTTFPFRKKWTINDYGPVIVPENHYFVLGDNRSNSIDSRFYGFIPEENIIGKVDLVLFSLNPSKSFWKKCRWNRLLHSIK